MRRLACLAALLFGCGIGETISLGATASAPAPGGAGAGVGGASGTQNAGGSGGTHVASDASMQAPPDAGDDASTDAGSDASVSPRLCVPQVNGGVAACTREAFPEPLPLSLTLHFEWPAAGQSVDAQGVITSNMPLVGSFTDDDGNGRVDACDVPDVLVVAAFESGVVPVLLSGDTGEEIARFAGDVASGVVPALADLDADGSIDVATFSPNGDLLIFDRRGTLVNVGSTSTLLFAEPTGCHALSIADLEGDGVPEIIGGWDVFDSTGTRRFGHVGDGSIVLEPGECNAPLAADLDGDGALEVIFGTGEVFSADGTPRLQLGMNGTPFIASFQGTPLPELIFASSTMLTLTNEGSLTLDTMHEQACVNGTVRFADIDQDGLLDMIVPACGVDSFELEPQTLALGWVSPLLGSVGAGAVTLFDLRGRGVPDVIHASPSGLFIHAGESGDVLAQNIELPASSSGLGPIVADVDNDGSAEILLLSDNTERPRLLVARAVQRDFAPARRIYNQYANQVSHVNENGVAQRRPMEIFPSHMTAHVEGGRLCLPLKQ